MKTLIKWPGGKKSEIKYIKDLIPEFENYVEPFLGGGALFFDLEPNNAYINDISTDLIQFYKILADKDARKNMRVIMLDYNEYWNSLKKISDNCYDGIMKLYEDFKLEKINKNELKSEINIFLEKHLNLFIEKFPDTIYLDEKVYLAELNRNLYSKITRTVKLDLKKSFSANELKANMETALRSSFFMHERYKMNAINAGKIKLTDEENSSNFYFVREYCYGSMFRYNKNGEFNIPYGGMSYNKKDFLEKINNLFSQKTYNVLKTANIENLDFEEFFNKHEFTENDFIFFDPPYDTDFSSYANNAFTLEDQKRLANCIYKLKSKFIFIIKKTDFIWNLYEGKENIKIESFDKKYSYNMRGRNNRDVEHLIIHNLENPQQKMDDYK